MNLGIGIDAVHISRFSRWLQFHPTTLKRVYSQEELSYCLSNTIQAPQRLAVRFAAKEALYKALCQFYTYPPCLLAELLRHASVRKTRVYPQLEVAWPALKLTPLEIHLSLSHTTELALAYVIVSLSKDV